MKHNIVEHGQREVPNMLPLRYWELEFEEAKKEAVLQTIAGAKQMLYCTTCGASRTLADVDKLQWAKAVYKLTMGNPIRCKHCEMNTVRACVLDTTSGHIIDVLSRRVA